MPNRAIVRGFFDPATNSVSYVVHEPATRAAAIIDPVLDFSARNARTSTGSADALLDYIEAAAHPANAERQAVIEDGRWLHPQIAPRLASQPLATHFEIATKGGDYAAILAEAGLGENDISHLIAAGAVIANKD